MSKTVSEKENLLLVEGISDQSFFEEFCPKNILTVTDVSPPKAVGGTYNSKQGVLNNLNIHLKQLGDGKLKRLALVVDADMSSNGEGFDKTLKEIKNKIESLDNNYSCKHLESGGFIFEHSDGLPDVGLWIMPDNKSDGSLESWIIKNILSSSEVLFSTAEKAVEALASPLFTATKRKKADLATWLAWQKKPGEGLYYTIEGSLLDSDAPLYKGLRCWVEKLFPEHK